MTNHNELTAHIALIRLPASLQQSYDNNRLFINEDNEIISTRELSDLIQIIWTTPEGNNFITSYKTKSKQILKGSYNTSVTQTKDYLRDYLVRPIIKQYEYPEHLTNAQLLNILIKDQVYIDFERQTNLSEKGNQYYTYSVSK